MSLIKQISADLRFYGGKSFFKKIATFLFKPSFILMLNYRLGHYLFYHRFPLSSMFIIYLKYRQLKYGSCHFSYESTIGQHLNLPHPVGIVIGRGTVLEDNVTLYQNCTLGQKDKGAYPIIKRNATIFPSSTIAGKIVVGEGATIGANSFVDKSVGDNEMFYRT